MKKLFAILSICLIAHHLHALDRFETVKPGQKAPELEYADPSGKTLKLSELTKNRIVLLDFWASWCGPCRAASPRVVQIYNTYSNKKFKNAKKGFTVVSISLDRDKQAWIDAIKKDNLSWPYHMCDFKGKPALTYGVQFIPQSFLIDEKGNIIGQYNSLEQAEDQLKKLLTPEKSHKG